MIMVMMMLVQTGGTGIKLQTGDIRDSLLCSVDLSTLTCRGITDKGIRSMFTLHTTWVQTGHIG